MPFRFPEVIETEHLLLRCWKPSDASRLKAAIDGNLAHLQPWMPWAMNEPSALDEIAARIERFVSDFAAGIDGTYGIFSRDGSVVLGGSGLHPRIEDGLEIGYWIDAAHTRRGHATEVAAALTPVAFDQPGVREVQIRCDPRNLPSAAIPRRLGYRHIETLQSDALTPTGDPRDTMVWQMTRERFEAGALSSGP